MSEPTAGRVDLAKLAPNGLTVSGEMPLEELSRLAAAVRGATRPIAYQLTLRRDPRGFVRATGAVQATVSLTCQRCLQDMAWSIDAAVAVGIVESEGLIERLPDTLEPHLANAGVVTVADLVEDELLLALPLVAMHEAPGECPAAVAESDPGPVENARDNDNPFAVLARLKTKP